MTRAFLANNATRSWSVRRQVDGKRPTARRHDRSSEIRRAGLRDPALAEIWMVRLPASGMATPVTYMGKKTRKQFVGIAAGAGTNTTLYS